MRKIKLHSVYPRLFRRKNGYWYIETERGNTSSLGTRDHQEAKIIFNEEQRKFLNNNVVRLEKIQRITLQEYMVEYIKERENMIAAGTLKNDDLAFRKLIEAIGNMPLRLVNREKVNKFKATMLRVGLSKVYINILLRCLRAAFNSALRPVPGVREPYIQLNPFAKQFKGDIVLYNLGDPEDQLPAYYTENELHVLFQTIDRADFLLAANIYYLTGVRRSELVRTNVQEVDLDSRSIPIRKSKNKAGRMATINNDDLFAAISYYMRKCSGSPCLMLNAPSPLVQKLRTLGLKKAPDIGPLFPQWRNANSLSRLFRKYRLRAGIKGTLHDLRHTCATDLLNAGEDIRVVQKLLGHKRIETTLIYAKVKLSSLHRAGNRLKSPLTKG